MRFLYAHPIAQSLDLPGILRDPAVYKAHPEPDVAAAIMVVHRFAPNIASVLFNYKVWAMHPAAMPNERPELCPCHTQVLEGATKVDGHVLSTNPAELASPYLRGILSKGKKYRLRQPVSSVLAHVRDGINEYLDYKKRRNRDDPEYHKALDTWAHAVMARARWRATEAAKTRPQEPDGYPDMDNQLAAAQNALVFGPEDRAPHAVFFACGRAYAAKLHARLEEEGAFGHETATADELLRRIEAFNQNLSLKHHKRLPYLYGAWKAKKQTFRWIAGTSRVQDGTHEAEDNREEEGPPRNALSEAGKLMVKVLQTVMATLRGKDRQRVADGSPSRYWVIEDIDEFVQEFRVVAATLGPRTISRRCTRP